MVIVRVRRKSTARGGLFSFFYAAVATHFVSLTISSLPPQRLLTTRRGGPHQRVLLRCRPGPNRLLGARPGVDTSVVLVPLSPRTVLAIDVVLTKASVGLVFPLRNVIGSALHLLATKEHCPRPAVETRQGAQLRIPLFPISVVGAFLSRLGR